MVENDKHLAAGPDKKVVRGTHRSVPIEETLERVSPRLRSFGITRVANITGLDDIGIPTVMVCRPNSRSLRARPRIMEADRDGNPMEMMGMINSIRHGDREGAGSRDSEEV